MTNPRRTALLTTLKLSDLGVVTSAFLVAVYVALHGGDRWYNILEMRIQVRNVLFMALYLGYWHLVLRGFGLYFSYRLSSFSREWHDLAVAALVGTAPLAVLGKPFDFDFVTPSFLLAFVSMSFIGLAAERRFLRAVARRMRQHGRNLRNVVVVGSGVGALDMASRLARRGDLGYRIVEVLELDTQQEGAKGAAGDAVVLDRVADLLAKHPIDEVFLAVPLDRKQELIRSMVALCEEQGTTIRLVSSVVDLMLARAELDEIDGRPVMTIFTGPPDSLLLVVKRLFDIAASAAALIVLGPLFAVVAIAIRMDSPGPVLYVQDRVGLNGRRFPFFKFRTMVFGADRMQAELEHLNEAEGPIFKIRNDPRITRVGRVIRRLSLDELPQLINVLKGDMSLVGPRALPVRDVARFDVRAHRRRFSVKPGITCLWQVNGREPRFEDWIKTDMEYIDNWSLALDFKILVKTIPAVLSGRGAY